MKLETYTGAGPKAALVLAHGAGTSQKSPFMVRFARGMAERHINTATFDFPYISAGRKVPDRAPVLEQAWRDALDAGTAEFAPLPLYIGGKSMGGRMASHIAAQGSAGIKGLVFLGYNSQEEVAALLEKMFRCLKPGGRIAIMGPNFKYAYRAYFDFADHTVILSELGVAEHLYGAGFEIGNIYPRFLPLSFRGGIPVSRLLVRTYLSMSWAWRFFGKQFLLIGKKL